MKGEKIYEYDLDVTKVTDYGVTLEDVLSGKTSVPMQGVRIDIAFEGRATGRLAGQLQGIDYLLIRADSRVDLNIHAIIETEEGHRIALAANGVCLPHPGEPIADLRENVELITASEDYAWVNTRQIWGVGTVDFASGKIHVEAYMQ
jgi:hypothetical protein